ncbi:MAG: hypothetical protein ACO2PN_22430 [Pyrobaculum sp.]|jgi:hypothetical protein
MRELEEAWVEVLAHIYGQVRWHRIRGRSHLDVFEHRLEYAKYEPDVPSALQRLANALSLQGINVPLDRVELLRSREEEAMELLRRWTKLLALKAQIRAKELKQQKRKAEGA